ncbi:hypothetical protein KW791_03115 [Candidatus Parcubacteria bacterium]|nr:hypothetical protein [Candidatus Parcubacteria bacterium]
MPKAKAGKKTRKESGGIELGVFLERHGVGLNDEELDSPVPTPKPYKDPDLYEVCVMPKCGKLTDVRKDLHIDFRHGYIEGLGQLCPECFCGLDK